MERPPYPVISRRSDYLKKVLSTALMPTSVIVVPSGKVSKVLLAVGCVCAAMT
jgi:hypothetical protein